MDINVDIWLRGENHATTHVIPSLGRDPRSWTDTDVSSLLADMLRAIQRAKDPAADQDRPVALRGFSWIVNPFEGGGVILALELSLGAVIAGPFDIPERELTRMIERVMSAERSALSSEPGGTVH